MLPELSGRCSLPSVCWFPWILPGFVGQFPVLSRLWNPTSHLSSIGSSVICLNSFLLPKCYWHHSIVAIFFPILLVLVGLFLFNSYIVILMRVAEKWRLMHVFIMLSQVFLIFFSIDIDYYLHTCAHTHTHSYLLTIYISFLKNLETSFNYLLDSFSLIWIYIISIFLSLNILY